MSDPDAVAKLKKFLERAERDPDHSRKYFGKKSDHQDIEDPEIKQELKALDEAPAHKRARERAGIDLTHDKPWTPSRKLCSELLDLMADFEKEHGHTPSPPYDQIYVVVRFAMPLVPTAESEGGAAG